MKEANRKLNSVRDKQNKIGREVIKNGGTVDAKALEELKDLRLKTPGSNNKRRLAAPRPKSAKKPQNPLVTPLKSPAKRKVASGRSSTTKVKYESEDSDEDAFSDDFNTPSKRRGTGNRGSAVARSRNTTTPRKSAAGTTPSKRPPRAAAVAADARRKALVELDESERSELSQTPAPALTKEEIAIKAQEQRALGSADDSIEDKEARYKLTICDVLGVEADYADHLSLQDLRTYARAFNHAFGVEEWKVPNTEGTRAVGPNIFPPGVQDPDPEGIHIALAIPRFQELAIARGDLLADLTVNQAADSQKLVTSLGNVEIDRALGVIQNEFGRFAVPEDHE